MGLISNMSIFHVVSKLGCSGALRQGVEGSDPHLDIEPLPGMKMACSFLVESSKHNLLIHIQSNINQQEKNREREGELCGCVSIGSSSGG